MDKLKDKVKLLAVGVLCAGLAWGFWYLLGSIGLYLIGGIAAASYASRIYKKLRS